MVKKFRYSGFYGTPLENLLRALGRDTIAITGVATNVCCDSTARGAMRDFKVVFLSDCSASFSPEEQDATLKNFEKHFGLVWTRTHLSSASRNDGNWFVSVPEPQPES